MTNNCRFGINLGILSLISILFLSSLSCNIQPKVDINNSDSIQSQFSINVAAVTHTKDAVNLMVDVDVIPNQTFTGRPFITRVVGGNTVSQSSPILYLALLSRDGHYFDSTLLSWSEYELQTPSPTKRDYSVIQAIENRRVKHLSLGVPEADKDVVHMYQELGGYYYDARANFSNFFVLVIVTPEQIKVLWEK